MADGTLMTFNGQVVMLIPVSDEIKAKLLNGFAKWGYLPRPTTPHELFNNLISVKKEKGAAEFVDYDSYMKGVAEFVDYDSYIGALSGLGDFNLMCLNAYKSGRLEGARYWTEEESNEWDRMVHGREFGEIKWMGGASLATRRDLPAAFAACKEFLGVFVPSQGPAWDQIKEHARSFGGNNKKIKDLCYGMGYLSAYVDRDTAKAELDQLIPRTVTAATIASIA